MTTQTAFYDITDGNPTYTVPVGVTSVNIVISGGAGGNFGLVQGGQGGQITATNVSVSPGDILTLAIGGKGQDGSVKSSGEFSQGGKGGANGGNGGSANFGGFPAGAGGGGSSHVQSSLQQSFLLVAAGGGGASVASNGGNGFSPGTDGGGLLGAGGKGGQNGMGGTGGNGLVNGQRGGTSSEANGGDGGNAPNRGSVPSSGGGGGAGWGGGGGGAGNDLDPPSGGGGGGANFISSSVASHTLGNSSGDGTITITSIVPSNLTSGDFAIFSQNFLLSFLRQFGLNNIRPNVFNTNICSPSIIVSTCPKKRCSKKTKNPQKSFFEMCG